MTKDKSTIEALLTSALNPVERDLLSKRENENRELDELKKNREKTYYLIKERDLLEQRLKRYNNLNAFSKNMKGIRTEDEEVSGTKNKYENIKGFDDAEDLRLVEYIDKKTNDLKSVDNFEGFKQFVQQYFCRASHDSDITKERIEQIKREFEENKRLIENKFKIHFDIFDEIIKSLEQIRNIEKFDEELEKVAEALGIDNKGKLKERIKHKAIESDTDINQPLVKELKDIEDKSSNHRDIYTPTNEPLDGEDERYRKYKEEYNALKAKHGTKYQAILREYEEIRNYTKEQIREYGEKTKNKEATYTYNENSAIAILIRANEIATGHSLREVQILAILEFLDGNTNKFCQINTGEGKTTITSALAVLRVLQGKTVDIITSNQVLAKDAIRERKDFYALFGISITDNNPDLDNPYLEGLKKCYTHDVVYGTIGAFAFDHLHNNVEALGTKVLHIKSGIPVVREYDTVIVDESDNVILDNYALITNQAKSIAGVDQVKFIYIDIWIKLIKAEKELSINQLNITDENKKAIKEQINTQEIAESIDRDERIPYFLKELVKGKLNLLIDNAIRAKYDLHVNEDYVINKKDDEDNILPLEKEIGVRLQNFIWTDLHPFLQMKHNLHVNSCGSLTSVFIPNCAYLNLYEKKYGLTGTSGSEKEMGFIRDIYSAESTIIPPFTPSIRQDLDPIMLNDENHWLNEITTVAEEYSRRQQRAVLFVCDTPKALKKIELKLRESGYTAITTYENEGDAHKIESINKDGIQPGAIVIATNIGGRGTDIKLSNTVKTNAGLHECTTYLPKNMRTQKQASGRAGRSGEPGSSQIIFQRSEVNTLETFVQKWKEQQDGVEETRNPLKVLVEELNTILARKPIEQEEHKDEEQTSSTEERPFKNEVEYALALRDKVEEIRLAQAKSHLGIMLGKYQQFKKFENYYYNLKKFKKINHFILEDLKLDFGLCYDKADSLQLEEFLQRMEGFFQKIESYVKDNCAKYKFVNPHYAVKYAQSLIRAGDFNKARQVLSLDELLTNNGLFYVTPIDGDGNCFYRALADQLQQKKIQKRGQSGYYTYQELRQRAIEYITEHIEEFRQEAPPEFGTMEQYIEHHSKDGAWAEGIMITTIEQNLELDVPIALRLYGTDGHIIPRDSNDRAEATILNLLYNGKHYDSLMLSQNTTQLKTVPVDLVFDVLPAYHFAMFEIELSKGSNIFYRILQGVTSIDVSSYTKEEQTESKQRAKFHLDEAQKILREHLEKITQLIDSQEFKEICLEKEDQACNFGDNMMQKHLESEQSLIIATIAHTERLAESCGSGNNQIVIKKTYRFEQIIENGLEVDLSIDGVSKSEMALADTVGLGVYYEIEELPDLEDNSDVQNARLKIAGGAALLLTAYIPYTRLVAPAIAVPAGKLIRRGTKQLLSLIFSDPDIDDEVEDIKDYITDMASSSGGPVIVVPRIVTTVLMQVGQSFLVNYLIKNFGKKLLNLIKQTLGGPIKRLIKKPLITVYQWKQRIFNNLKKFMLDPIKKLFQFLLGKARESWDQIVQLLLNPTNTQTTTDKGAEESKTDTQEGHIIQQITNAKQLFFNIFDHIVLVKNILFEVCHKSFENFNQFKLIKELINFFKSFKSGSSKSITSLISIIKDFISSRLHTSITAVIENISAIITSVITTIPEYVNITITAANKFGSVIKGIVETIRSNPIQFFSSLTNSLPSLIRNAIFDKGYDLLANIMHGIMSYIEGVFDSIFRNNPIDKFLNKYGIDLSNPVAMINKVCSYLSDMIMKFIKSMIFQPPKQVNENRVDSSPSSDEAVQESTKTQQCVPFALAQLFGVEPEELLNVTRTYISTKIKADQGLTDWQTKFIIEDLGLKVFDSKPQKSEYSIKARKYLQDHHSVGGVGLFVRIDKSGHAYFISETESVRFIDEANPEGVIDLTTEDYTKGTFLIPMNFSQNRRSEISKRIKENPNPNDSFVFMFWLRRIWEKLFPGQTFGTDSISNQTTFINQVVPKSKNINEIRRQIKAKTKILEKDQNNAKAQAELIQLKQEVKNFESKYVKTVELLITEVNLILNEISNTIPRIIANHIQIVLVKNNYAEGRVWQLSIKEKKSFQTWSIVLAQQFFKKNQDYQTKLITAITSSTPGFLDMYKNCSITFNTRLPKFKDNSNTFCGNFEIIFKDNPQNQIITWNFHSYTTGILLKEYEHAVDPGLPNNQDAVAYDLQKGTNSNDLMHLTGISELFYEYTMEGIGDILGLRLSTEASISGLTNTLVLPGSYIFGEKHSNIHTLLFYLNLYIISIMLHRNKHAMKRVNPPVILTPISLHGKHAVGIMFVAQGDGSGYKAFYLDPENTDIPEGLAIIFKDNGYQIEQLPTEGQLYTNCGPEVIENFMLYLTGERLSQEDAIVNNSRLVEQELLSSSHDAEEASCLTLKDSYSKQDAVTAISNVAGKTQVSSDGYIIGNPTRYDIVTPQSIIDGVVVRADLGREPCDVLLELVHDYRINQDYVESILGEIASIDIS